MTETGKGGDASINTLPKDLNPPILSFVRGIALLRSRFWKSLKNAHLPLVMSTINQK